MFRKKLHDLSDQFCNVYPEKVFQKLKTISSLHRELMLCFLCCFATSLSSSFRMNSLFGKLRVVFLFTKITDPAITSAIYWTRKEFASADLFILFFFYSTQRTVNLTR